MGGGGGWPLCKLCDHFSNIVFKKIYSVSYKNKVLSPPPGYLITKKNKMMYYIKEVYTRKFMKINTIFNRQML